MKYFTNKIKSFFSKLGYRLQRNADFNHCNESIKTLIKISKKLYEINLNDGMAGVVFSKDRPMQLFALLESYFLNVSNPVELYVLYSANDETCIKSYDEICLQFKGKNINFVIEKFGFYNSFSNLIKGLTKKNIFFLVDDDLFINKIDFDKIKNINTDKYIFSMRLGENIHQSYNFSRKICQPNFIKTEDDVNFIKFSWSEGDGEWGDPWSLDGHVFSLAEILVLMNILYFNGPNTLEAGLKDFHSLACEKFGLSHKRSVILNLPINCVQNEFDNKSGEVGVEFLEDNWLKGYKFDISDLLNYQPSSTHEIHMLNFTKRLS